MQKVFLIYWFIGVVFVLGIQIMGLLFKMSLGKRYVPPKATTSFLTGMLANLLLTVCYPAFVFGLVLNDMRQRQMKRFIESKLGSIEAIIAEQMKSHPEENQNE